VEAVELATLKWVDWFNHRRLMQPLGYVPPAELESMYYQQQSRFGERLPTKTVSGIPGALQ
jgi:hypothetical protein